MRLNTNRVAFRLLAFASSLLPMACSGSAEPSTDGPRVVRVDDAGHLWVGTQEYLPLEETDLASAGQSSTAAAEEGTSSERPADRRVIAAYRDRVYVSKGELSSDVTELDDAPLQPDTGESGDDDVGVATSKFIFGIDNRARFAPPMPPETAVVRLSNGGGSCSGAFVGATTILTAAHCVFNAAGASFGPTQVRRHDSTLMGSTSCGALVMTLSGWIGGGADLGRNFAVIDTSPCGVQQFARMPRNLQFTGIWPNVPEASLASVGLLGYPAPALIEPRPSAAVTPIATVRTCPGSSTTVLCGMFGSAYTNGPFLESDNLDLSSGQGGGPWFVSSGGSHWVLGVTAGERNYFDLGRCGFANCLRDAARRIDNDALTLIRSVSVEY